MPRFDALVRQAVQKQQIPLGVMVFKFADVHEELRFFKNIVADKVTPESLRKLQHLINRLEIIALSDEGGRVRWCTDIEGIETVPNEGCHQIGRGQRGRNLKGVASFVWEIEPCGRANAKFPLNRAFALRNSSVRMKLVEVPLQETVATWDLDIGDDVSPGCHFHAKFSPVQEAVRDGVANVDVPRLPSILFMPTDAIEFLLGELWQEEWRKSAAASTVELNSWRKYPKRRLLKILGWCLNEVRQSRTTAWSHLKLAKPDSFLLWEEE